jgi:hypothetical protein
MSGAVPDGFKWVTAHDRKHSRMQFVWQEKIFIILKTVFPLNILG